MPNATIIAFPQPAVAAEPLDPTLERELFLAEWDLKSELTMTIPKAVVSTEAKVVY
jgi:hypothetical protein